MSVDPQPIAPAPAEQPAPTIWCYTIYERPADYPDQYVVRAWFVERGAVSSYEPVALADTLDDARALIPGGRRRIERCKDDDPVIVESWL